MARVDVDARELTGVQQGVLRELTEEGIAIVPFADLIADEGLWGELRAEMDAFVAETIARLASGAHEQRKQKDKYLVRRFPRGKSKLPVVDAVLPSDGCWLRFAAHDRLLDVVNAYRGGPTKLVDFDQWYTLPAGGRKRIASQQWHRDPEDEHVVKVFLYFSDVDEDAGPFEYVRQSPAGRRYGDLWPWADSDVRYPPGEELERAVAPSDRVLATGPAGTLVVCDTSGFHRGGYVRSKPRVLSTHTYVQKEIAPGSKRRKFTVDWRGGELSEQAVFALS
jgi:hypothetical protein